MLNLVFIDIDGVARPKREPRDYVMDQYCVDMINKVLNALDAQVVISSEWRLAFSKSYFNAIFQGRVIGMTGDRSINATTPYPRWEEIQQFLNALPKPPAQYWILDDREDLFPRNLQSLILCDPLKGFGERELRRMSLNQHTENLPYQENTNTGFIRLEISLTNQQAHNLKMATNTNNAETALREAVKTTLERHISPRAPTKGYPPEPYEFDIGDFDYFNTD